MWFTISSVSMVPSSFLGKSSKPFPAKAAFILAAVSPLWLLCASSIIIPKLDSCKSSISLSKNGNVCTVQIIIFFLLANASFNCEVLEPPFPVIASTVDFTCANRLMFSLICLSNTVLSVTTITESKR